MLVSFIFVVLITSTSCVTYEHTGKPRGSLDQQLAMLYSKGTCFVFRILPHAKALERYEAERGLVVVKSVPPGRDLPRDRGTSNRTRLLLQA